MARAKAMRIALTRTDTDNPELAKQLQYLSDALDDLDIRMHGSKAKAEIGELDTPTVQSRYGVARSGLSTTYGPTTTDEENLEIARDSLKGIRNALDALSGVEIPKLERALQDAGAPWIVGQPLPKS